MNSLPNNFGSLDLCEFSCQEFMNNYHLLNCPVLNEGQPTSLKIEHLFNGNIEEKIQVYRNSEKKKWISWTIEKHTVNRKKGLQNEK